MIWELKTTKLDINLRKRKKVSTVASTNDND